MTAELGAYRGAADRGIAGFPATETWLRRPVTRALDSLFFTQWGDGNVANSPVSLGQWAIGLWAKQTRKMAYSLPLTCKGTPLADVGAGKHDDAYTALGKMLVSKGQPDAVLRLGWEFNGGWYPWAASADPTGWVAAFRRVVQTMRAVPGQAFRFDWNPTLGFNQIPADKVYPGDDAVDIIGLDVYNQWWTDADKDPVARWRTLLTQDFGLNWLARFAGAHGKPISLPEWGTGTRPDGHGGGDDPLFVRNMTAWIQIQNVAYHNYWDFAAGDYNARLSDGHQPLAGAAFLAAFGAPPADPLQTQVDALAAQVAQLQATRDGLQGQLDAATVTLSAMAATHDADTASIAAQGGQLASVRQAVSAFNAAMAVALP